MAVPFAQMPTLADVIGQAKSEGCTLVQGPLMVGPHGPVQVEFLLSTEGRFAVLPTDNRDERLAPTVLRSICVQIGKDLGYRKYWP